jgi:hypothetical protein
MRLDEVEVIDILALLVVDEQFIDEDEEQEMQVVQFALMQKLLEVDDDEFLLDVMVVENDVNEYLY